MTARIYKPARNAMQSGKGKATEWFLEFVRETRHCRPAYGLDIGRHLNSGEAAF